MVTSDLLLACLGILLDWGEGVIGRGVMVTSVMVLAWLLVILWVRGEGVIGRGVMYTSDLSDLAGGEHRVADRDTELAGEQREAA